MWFKISEIRKMLLKNQSSLKSQNLRVRKNKYRLKKKKMRNRKKRRRKMKKMKKNQKSLRSAKKLNLKRQLIGNLLAKHLRLTLISQRIRKYQKFLRSLPGYQKCQKKR